MSAKPFEEIEIKLRVPANAAGAIKRSPLIRDHKTARARGRHLLSVYFDTERLDLRAAKAALRVRHMGRAREQTLKTAKGMTAGLQSRSEWNAAIEGDQPDLSLIEDKKLRKWLRRKAGAEGLVPVFTTDIRRTAWPVAFKGSRFEVALDQGRILSGDKAEDICEVELELLEGDVLDMMGFALMLSDRHGLAVDKDSKAARGYRLYSGAVRAAVRAEEPALSARHSPWEAFAASVQSGVAQILSNAPIARLGLDPEGVHQTRVGVRRMRAALSVFRPILKPEDVAAMRDDLRMLQQELGQARDLDVFIGETLAPMLQRIGHEVDLSALIAGAHRAREQGYARARAALDGAALTQAILGVEGRLLEIARTPPKTRRLDAYARRVMDKRWKRVLRAAGPDPASLPDEELHPLRIELKKLRYAAGFFVNVYDRKRARRYIKTAAALQDCLGALNDALVQEEVLDDAAFRTVRDDAAVMGALAGWRSARVVDGLHGLEKAWGAMTAAPKFWRDD